MRVIVVVTVVFLTDTAIGAAVLCSARPGFRGDLQFCPARPSVCAADFLHARWSSALPGAGYVAVFCTARRGIHGGLAFCPARLSMCAAVFGRAVRGVAGSS